ncbi:MAG: L-aspartate oxidase [Clostridiales bacterium]|nr:L-aspartate oxidase [Clostridiales bacterium]
MKTEVLIVGCGVAGLYAALSLPRDKQIIMITKSDLESSDSYLAQGGICMLRDEDDYHSFFHDTLEAGHFENNLESVDIMIRSSQETIQDLIGYGVDFETVDGELCFTREGAHSANRILYHKDITGEEITSKLLARVKELKNVTLMEYTTMIDLIADGNTCCGIVATDKDGKVFTIEADGTLLACGGIGGLYAHSTNFPHLTGDGLAVCLKHGVELLNPDYVQIHPTTLYTNKPGRSFLISESVRGEGALLYNKAGERFVNELLPRDQVTKAIHKQMKEDGTEFVHLDMRPIGIETILHHFPNIYQKCVDEGFDPTKEPIPVVPAQHYFMGGIKVNRHSKTSMERLYAAGETSCNGVHGANRLASNSLLESLVFAKRAAHHMAENVLISPLDRPVPAIDKAKYENTESLQEEYKKLVLNEIERINRSNE